MNRKKLANRPNPQVYNDLAQHPIIKYYLDSSHKEKLADLDSVYQNYIFDFVKEHQRIPNTRDIANNRDAYSAYSWLLYQKKKMRSGDYESYNNLSVNPIVKQFLDKPMLSKPSTKRKGGNRNAKSPLETMPVELFANVLSNLAVEDLMNLAQSSLFVRRLPELTNIGFVYHPKRALETDEVQWFQDRNIPLGQYVEHRVWENQDNTIERWLLNGKILHNEVGPAFIHTSPIGATAKYWNHGQVRRDDDGPVIIYTYPSGLRIEEWYQNDGNNKMRFVLRKIYHPTGRIVEETLE